MVKGTKKGGVAARKGRGKKGKTDDEPEEITSTIKKDCSELCKVILKEPGIEQKIREVLDHHLKGPVNRYTSDDITNGLNALIGEGATRFLLNVSTIKRLTRETFNKLGKFKVSEIDKTLPFLQHFAALYGSNIVDAFSIMKEYPDEWKRGTIHLHRVDKKHFIEMDLKKYNDENIFLKMTPKSVFHLCGAILEEIGKMPKNSISKEVIKKFNERAEGFKKKFIR